MIKVGISKSNIEQENLYSNILQVFFQNRKTLTAHFDRLKNRSYSHELKRKIRGIGLFTELYINRTTCCKKAANYGTFSEVREDIVKEVLDK